MTDLDRAKIQHAIAVDAFRAKMKQLTRAWCEARGLTYPLLNASQFRALNRAIDPVMLASPESRKMSEARKRVERLGGDPDWLYRR